MDSQRQQSAARPVEGTVVDSTATETASSDAARRPCPARARVAGMSEAAATPASPGRRSRRPAAAPEAPDELARLNELVTELTAQGQEWKHRAELAEAKLADRDEELSRMTLGELEATAERMGKAVATIKEAQSLLGGKSVAKATRSVRAELADEEEPPPPRPEVPADAVAAHRARQFQPPDVDAPRELRLSKRPRLSAQEEMQRRGLLAQFSKPAVDPNLPEDIAALEQGDSPR
jgi:hypothetical protein